MSDDMRIVAEIGESMASANPKDLVIRVIRATANESWEEAIRCIATKPDLTPPNMFTLWIREDVPMCGQFNPKNPSLSLVDQLLDRRPFSLVHSLLGGLGVPEENIVSAEDDCRESHSRHQCSSCGEMKPKTNFSKSQLRKYGREARCKECVLSYLSNIPDDGDISIIQILLMICR